MLVVVPDSDTTRDPVVVVDGVIVSDEVDVAVIVTEAVAVELVDVTVVVTEAVAVELVDVTVVVAVTVGAEPVDAGIATVAFADIGAVAATEDRKAEASERADDAADGMAVAVAP